MNSTGRARALTQRSCFKSGIRLNRHAFDAQDILMNTVVPHEYETEMWPEGMDEDGEAVTSFLSSCTKS